MLRSWRCSNLLAGIHFDWIFLEREVGDGEGGQKFGRLVVEGKIMNLAGQKSWMKFVVLCCGLEVG